jgi:hypothetical protein
MKDKLILSLLFSLFTGVAMHASDTHKQKTAKNKRLITKLVRQCWPEANYIVVLPFTDNFPVVRVFFKATTITLPVMEDKKRSVFKYKSAHYYLTSIQEPASLLHHKRIIRGLTQLTLTPNSY